MKPKDTIHFNWYKYLFVVLVIGLCIAVSARVTETNILNVSGDLEQMSGFLSRFLKLDFPYIPRLIGPMVSTLQMPMAGIALGVVFAMPAVFLGTTTVAGSRVVTSAIRLLLNTIRTIPNLLLVVLTVATVRIREFTGVTIIAVFTFGLVSQLVHEAVEAIDEGPIEAAALTGANKARVVFWSVVPQTVSQVTGYTFYALKVDVRASAVLGYVGAGGIGIILNSSLTLLQYDGVSIIILLILVVMVIVDGFSGAIRRRLARWQIREQGSDG